MEVGGGGPIWLRGGYSGYPSSGLDGGTPQTEQPNEHLLRGVGMPLAFTQEDFLRDFVNTRLLVHKYVKISVDEWILETTRPHKHVIILITSEYFLSIFLFRAKLEAKILFLRLFELLFSHFLVEIIFKTLVEQLKDFINKVQKLLILIICSKLWTSEFQCGRVDFRSHSST